MWKRNGSLCWRPMTMVEKYFIHWYPCCIQLALDIDDPAAVPICIEKIRNVTASLHLRADKDTVMLSNDVVKVHQLPEKLTNLEDCLKWSLLYAPVEKTWPLATLCANSHKVVLNSTHAFTDGVAFLNTVREILNPSNSKPIEILPLPMEHVLEQELQTAIPYPNPRRDPKITHVQFDRPDHVDFGDVLQMATSNYPVQELTCYQNGKVHGLTEWMCTSMILAAKAVCNLNDGFGIQLAVDMRPFLPKEKISFNTPWISGGVAISTSNPKTVGDLTSGLRRELNQAIASKQWLGTLKWAMTDGRDPYPKNGQMLYLSNVGQLRIKKPIKDVMVRINQVAPEDATCTVSYSVISETQNVVKTHMCYGSEVVSHEQMSRFNKLVEFGLRNMKKDWRIDETIAHLRHLYDKETD